MFTVQSRTVADRAELAFEIEGEALILSGVSEGTPDVVVQAYDPARDVFYSTPEPPSIEELGEELHIHFPESLAGKMEGKPMASMMGASVMMQVVEGPTPTISPLPALRRVLEGFGAVNSAILQCDNGGLLFVRRAGDEYTAHVSTHTISTFVNLTHDERGSIFPDFSAQEVILSGEDLDSLEFDLSDPLLLMRKIGIQDFVSLIDVTEDVFALVNTTPHRYTLAIGAAVVYAEIRRSTAA